MGCNLRLKSLISGTHAILHDEIDELFTISSSSVEYFTFMLEASRMHGSATWYNSANLSATLVMGRTVQCDHLIV